MTWNLRWISISCLPFIFSRHEEVSRHIVQEQHFARPVFTRRPADTGARHRDNPKQNSSPRPPL